MATPLSPVATPPPSTDPTNFFAWVFETNRRDLACTYALHAELGAVLVFATVYNGEQEREERWGEKTYRLTFPLHQFTVSCLGFGFAIALLLKTASSTRAVQRGRG